MHRRPDRFNRRSGGRSWNCRRSADCITATYGGRLEEFFSDSSWVFSDLESTAIREDSGPEGIKIFPKFAPPSNLEPAPLLLPPDVPPMNIPIFVVERVFGRDRFLSY